MCLFLRAGLPWPLKQAALQDSLTDLERAFHAIRFGDMERLKMVMEQLPSPDAANAKNETAMHIAAANGQLEIVRYLYEELHADANAAEGLQGTTPLIAAASLGHLNVVHYLIETAHVPVDQTTSASNRTALHASATLGHLHIVRYLVRSAQARLEIRDFRGMTPLLAVACDQTPNLEVAAYLIESGADIEARETPLGGYTPLICASAFDRLDLVLRLLEAGADVDARTPRDGVSSLWVAANLARIGVMKVLIVKGKANVEIRDHRDVTPLAIAANVHKFEAASTLISVGKADADALILNRMPLIFLCAYKKNGLDMLKLLVEEGNADIHLEDRSGWSILMRASAGGIVPIMRYLVSRPASVDHTDKAGLTALAVASLYGQEAAVRFLLEVGAKVDLADAAGRTPLHLAGSRGHLAIVRLLVEVGGASDTRRCSDGQSPLQHAMANGRDDVVQYLTKNESE